MATGKRRSTTAASTTEPKGAPAGDEPAYASRLGALIQAQRLQRELSLDEIAARVGTTAATLRRWETGASAPKAAQLNGLRVALKVSAEQLIEPPDPAGDLEALLAASLPDGDAAGRTSRRGSGRG
ncbi:MAG: helix-turn-helix domain-containing protein [Candidatus Limnocylindrales bacterium]